MEGSNTDSLRTLAPSWSLAGDDMLLTLLQNTHQRIVSKCQEVNTKLDEMTSSLDDASIDLQNVNNKFMSLSNRQFVESRVYDDDVDVTTQEQINKEPPKQPVLDELNMLKNSLAILESKHEAAEIIDDSDSDSDVEISVVLKPKDVYSHRPLPYIIGSQQWKNKWHAGLIIESSDTDSIPSKEQSDVEYSDSEVDDIQTDLRNDNTISESSSLQSDRVLDRIEDRVPDRIPQPTAAQIAANIASVMAKTQPLIERPVTPPSPKEYIPTKPPAVYRPTQPLTSNVFPDEPPPLDNSKYSSSSSEEDIFAEINKNKPYNQEIKVQSGITEDLFGKKETGDVFGTREREDIFGVPYDKNNSYFKDEPPPIKQKPPIKEQIASKSVEQQNIPKEEENTTKKPIGGISLFGSNKHTDTIGAAILKRNKRKSSTSDESGSDVPITNKQQTNMADESKNIDEIDNRKEETDIFENLFAKSKAASNKNPENNKKEQKTIVNNEKKQNKDLFADNIFDDVDDIFSSDIKIPSKTDKPSLFDDDDDDLFTDVAKSDTKISKTKDTKPQTVKSKLFDSDDELFSDIKTSEIDQEEKISSKTTHPTVTSKNEDNKEKVPPNIEQTSTPREQTLSKTAQSITTNKVVENISKPKPVSIFDSDSDDDIFNFNKPAPKSSIENSSANSKLKTEEIKKFQSPSLFDDDEIDELFDNAKNNKVNSKTDPCKIPANNTTIEKQEQKKIEPLADKISVDTDPLLAENEKGKSDLNIQTEKSESFENKENDRQDSDVSNNEKATSQPEAQSSISIEPTPSSDPEIFTSNSVNKVSTNRKVAANNTSNKLDETKVPEFDEILAKPKVSIFNNIEPSFEPQTFKDPIDNNIEEIPETPIFNEQIENMTKDKPETPISDEQIEHISREKPKVPIFEDTIENVAQETVTEVPIFNDIVTEPPAFEKTKEPKKSKNVNALFDDDSEDEALFFKKNDVISDEKPDVFSSAANFGLFTDEPPPDDFENDLFGSKRDTDSSPKDHFIEPNPILTNQEIESNKIDQKPDLSRQSAEKVTPNNDLSSKTEVPKSKLLQSQSLFGNDSDEDIFSFNKASTNNKPQDSLFKNENNSKNRESSLPSKTVTIEEQKSLFDDLDDNLFTPKTQKTENLTTDNNITVKKDTDTKKIGRLTTNLNINVQALVPGASPKKAKPEKIDAEPKVVKSIDPEPIIVKPIDTEPKMVKSISFEDEPEREVLDNNASKQRAKIQVKRRPSSRKARHEAIRKSALDFDHSVEQNVEPKDQKSSTDLENSPILDPRNIRNESSIEKLNLLHDKLDKDDQYVDIKEQNKNIEENVTKDGILHDTTESNINENINKNQNKENQKEKSTKVVYVLNDEDIFTNPIKNDSVTDLTASTSKSNEVFAKTEETSTEIVEKSTKTKDKADLTKIEKTATKLEETATKIEETTRKIEETATKLKETIPKLKENPTKQTKKISLFDSDEDEDDNLFKTKPKKTIPVIKQTKNTKLFDSDSEDDLFSKKKPNMKENDKIVKKKSLFDDDEGDDDIFGAKPKAKLENKPKSSTSSQKVEEKKDKSRTIFADPLSLFGDDDED